MINLLPYEIKKQTKAARLNVTLVGYVTIMILAAAFLALGCYTAYLVITNTKETNENQVVKTQPATGENQASAFRNNLVIAGSVLDQRTSYSALLTSLAAALPQGAVIESLSLADSSFGVPMDLKVKVKSADIEPKLKSALQTSPYFTNYQLISTTQNSDGSSRYPSILSIKLTFNKVTNQ